MRSYTTWKLHFPPILSLFCTTSHGDDNDHTALHMRQPTRQAPNQANHMLLCKNSYTILRMRQSALTAKRRA